jgi:aminopeptidase C
VKNNNTVIPIMKKQFLKVIIPALLTLPSFSGTAVVLPCSATEEGYKFTTVIDLKATPVRNQSRTGSCWSFATTSFIESELLRLGKGEYDLSEMFIVRYNYIDRLSDNFKRMGKGNIGEGGNAHDWIRVFNEYGIVPDELYTGLNYGSSAHDHTELQEFIKAVASVPADLGHESEQYHKIVDALLDIYLGKVPDSFSYLGVQYTPKTFASSLGINTDDYVEITSFKHFPFYSREILEIPDNWAMAKFYNVPLDELIEIIDYSLKNGYTVNWDGDTSEPGFTFSDGVAVNNLKTPDSRNAKTDRTRTGRSSQQSQSENTRLSSGPVPEVKVTQDIRQEGYVNHSTTDDHGMHLTGIVKDQNGNIYYKTKNSWGTEKNKSGGYLNMSESYVRAKTLFIMVNKNGIPPVIRTKLGI